MKTVRRHRVGYLVAQHQVGFVGGGQDNALASGQFPGLDAGSEEPLYLIVDAAHGLGLATLVYRSGNGQILAQGQAGKVTFKVHDTEDASEDKSGNSVNLEGEMMKVAKTTADHELMANLYRKGIDLMRVAISRPARG